MSEHDFVPYIAALISFFIHYLVIRASVLVKSKLNAFTLLTIACFFSFEASSQKIASDKIDPFDGSRTIITQPQSLGSLFVSVVSNATINKADTVRQVSFGLIVNQPTSVTAGQPVMIKFENDDIASLPVSIADDALSGEALVIILSLDAESAGVLKGNGVKLIRFKCNNRDIDLAIPSKRRTIIGQQLTALDDYMNK